MMGAKYHFTTPHPGLPVPESLAHPGQRSLPWQPCTHDPSHLKCVGHIDRPVQTETRIALRAAPRSKLRRSMWPTLPNEKELITHLFRNPLELFVSRTLRGFGPLEQQVTRAVLPTRGTSKDSAMGKNRFPNDFFPRIVRR